MNPLEQAEEKKRRSRGWSDDMSSDAIARRLQVVSDLYQVWRHLQINTAPAAPNQADIPSQKLSSSQASPHTSD